MTSPSESQRPPFRGQGSLPESLSTRFGHLFPGVWDHLTLSWYLSLSIHGPPICRLDYLLKLIVRPKATLQCFCKCLCRVGGYLSPNIWSLRVGQQDDILPFFSSNVKKKKKKKPTKKQCAPGLLNAYALCICTVLGGFTVSLSRVKCCLRKVKVAQTLCYPFDCCDPTDCSPPGSSVHGILQARILECVTLPSSRGSSQPI